MSVHSDAATESAYNTLEFLDFVNDPLGLPNRLPEELGDYLMRYNYRRIHGVLGKTPAEGEHEDLYPMRPPHSLI